VRAVVQRVHEASVRVDGAVVGQIGQGLLVLLGVGRGDTEDDVDYVADKVVNLRIFPDDAGAMNRSALDVGGEILAVSQFTLYGDVRRGRRPGFIDSAPPEEARVLYLQFVEKVRGKGLRTAEGVFQAMMDVSLVNHGPVTILIDSKKVF
jgi:D-aminoacyl-tRNA deacylase